MNWNKNRVMSSVETMLRYFVGDDVYRLRRPMVIEEPQLACAVLGFGIGGGFAIFYAALRRGRMRHVTGVAPEGLDKGRTCRAGAMVLSESCAI